jgi:hypothetical protein
MSEFNEALTDLRKVRDDLAKAAKETEHPELRKYLKEFNELLAEFELAMTDVGEPTLWEITRRFKSLTRKINSFMTREKQKRASNP